MAHTRLLVLATATPHFRTISPISAPHCGECKIQWRFFSTHMVNNMHVYKLREAEQMFWQDHEF